MKKNSKTQEAPTNQRAYAETFAKLLIVVFIFLSYFVLFLFDMVIF